MSDLNVVVLSGRLVSDPELRYTPKGMAVTSIRVASSRYYKDKNNTEVLKQNSLFITAETFGKLAEKVHSFIKKGCPIMVKGKLTLNEWKGNDGKTRQTYKIFAEDINWSKSKYSVQSPANESENEVDHSDIDTANADEEETIPF